MSISSIPAPSVHQDVKDALNVNQEVSRAVSLVTGSGSTWYFAFVVPVQDVHFSLSSRNSTYHYKKGNGCQWAGEVDWQQTLRVILISVHRHAMGR